MPALRGASSIKLFSPLGIAKVVVQVVTEAAVHLSANTDEYAPILCQMSVTGPVRQHNLVADNRR